MRINILFKGYITGLILQLAIGPVFLFILNLSLEFGFLKGFFAVLGVTLVDYLYIILAIYGAGKLLDKSRFKKLFLIVSSVILIIFGIILIRKGFLFSMHEQIDLNNLSLFQCFASTFILTISNPLTIIFWTSIFTNKSIEYSLTRKELFPFGLSAGFATLSFLGTSVLIFSLLNTLIPSVLIQILNIIVGSILICFGTVRIIMSKTINA